jgi:hypothetical protein
MFDSAFIEATRQAQGDEAANQLTLANQREQHGLRVEAYRNDPEVARQYPRMTAAIREGKLNLPVFASETEAMAYMGGQEAFLQAMGAPIPGVTPDPAAPATTPVVPTTDPALLGLRKGLIPWSSAATDASSLRPIAPGPSPGESQVIVGEVSELMQPKEGDFTRGRVRDFQMIKGMEVANSIPGGTQELRAMRADFEDPDTFTI